MNTHDRRLGAVFSALADPTRRRLLGRLAEQPSATASVESMWMHFHGQMSTQPSHMMHSAWSMWRNCLGLTLFSS